MADNPYGSRQEVQNEMGARASGGLDFLRVEGESRRNGGRFQLGQAMEQRRITEDFVLNSNGKLSKGLAPGGRFTDADRVRPPMQGEMVSITPIADREQSYRQQFGDPMQPERQKPKTLADMFDGMKRKAEQRAEARAEAKEEKRVQEKLEKVEKLAPPGAVGDLMKQAARQAVAGKVDVDDLQKRLSTATIADDQVDRTFVQIKQFQDALNKELGLYMYYGSNELFLSENNPQRFSSACLHIPAEGAVSTFDRMTENNNDGPVDRPIPMQEASARIMSKARWMARK